MCFWTSSSIPIPVSMILNSRTIGLFSTASETPPFLMREEVDSGDRPSRKKDELSSLLVLIGLESPSIGCSGDWERVSREDEDEEGEVDGGEVDGEDDKEGRDKVLWTTGRGKGGGLVWSQAFGSLLIETDKTT